jgi:hypothetical protein
MSRTMSFYDLGDALALSGCPVCRLIAKATERYLDSLLWENVNDPGMRKGVRRARGFCNRHAWELASHDAASLGVVILTRDVLQSVLEVMENAQFQAPPVLSLRRTQETLSPDQPAAATADLVSKLAPREPCPACAEADKMESIYLNALVENLLGEGGLLDDYRASDGLCLPHFRRALTRVRDEEVFDALMDAQQAIWERLVGHLSEVIRKSDYRFKDEPRGAESGAWLRAINAVSGNRPPER